MRFSAALRLLQGGILLGFILLYSSCKKDPGKGGTSVIQGQVWVRQYDNVFSTLNYSYWAKDENVYIIYGDDPGYSDNTSTDYEGRFFFPSLYKGAYKVFVYSADSALVAGPPLNPSAPDSAVVMDVEITENRQESDLGTITILKNK